MLTQLAHYRDLQKIGQGGMGVVYKAEDTRLGRDVALKVLPSLMNTDRARRSRFMREARAAAKLNHPTIATVFEVGEAPDETGLSGSDILYIAMEYVEGEDLSSRLTRGTLPLSESLSYAVQMAEALDVAHRSGVVHRDLKPHNVRILPDGRIKILDFGLAKLLQDEPLADESLLVTREGFIVGTVPYMAPEQVQGSGADSRSDLFSFGVVLYEMITGRLPFASGNLVEFVRSLTSQEPDRLIYSNPEVSPELERIVDKLLERQIEERYQSAEDVCRDLKAVSGSMAKAELNGSSAFLTRRRLRPLLSSLPGRRFWIWSAVALLVLIGTVFGTKLWLERPQEAGIVSLAIPPFETSDGFCRGLDQKLAVRLIGDPSIAVVTGQDANESQADLLLRGECREDESRPFVLTLVERRSGQVIWGDQVIFPETDDQLGELAYRASRAIATTQVVHQSSGRDIFSGDDLKALNLYHQGQQQLEEFTEGDQLNQAVISLQESTRLASNVAEFHSELSHAYWRRFTLNKNKEDSELAEAEADRAIGLNADLPAARIARARILRGREQYDAAIAELMLVEQKTRGRDLVHRELGLTADEANDFDRALHHYEMAVRLRPGYWRHRNQLGSLLLQNGSYEQARLHLEAAIKLAPGKPTITSRVNLGTLEFYEGRLDRAIELVESIPDEWLPASSLTTLGHFYFAAGRYDEAEKCFSRAKLRNPENFLHVANLADVYRARGESARATKEFERALDMINQQLKSGSLYHEELSAFRAKYLAKLDRCDVAMEEVDALRGFIDKKDLSSGTLIRLAQAGAMCGARDSALSILKIALQKKVLGPFNVELRSGEFSSLRGDPEFEELKRIGA